MEFISLVMFLILTLSCNKFIVAAVKVKMNEFVSYYEPVRIISIMYPQAFDDIQSVLVELYAFNRTFTFSAIFGKSAVISSDAQIETIGEDGKLVRISARSFLSRMIEGTLIDDPLSEVYGTFHDGMLDVAIRTKDTVYYIEPATKYLTHQSRFKSIMYRSSDVDVENLLCSAVKGKRCRPYRKSYNHGPFVNQSLPIRRNFKTKAMKIKHIMPSDTNEQQAFHKETTTSTKKLEVCLLKLVADHRYYQVVGKNNFRKTTEEMVKLVREASYIFRNTTFQIGSKNMSNIITLHIRSIFIHKSEFEPNYRLYDRKLTAEAFLQKMSEYNFDGFCLGVGFTFRNFKKRVLGLAYLADPNPDGTLGGICQERKYIPFRFKAMSYNVAFVSSGSEGRILPHIVNVLSLSHEIGHSFGAHHDPETDRACSTGVKGAFLMSARAVTGKYSNNQKFSPCSTREMGIVYEKKSHLCFKEVVPVCGNGIPEDFEECDCGNAFQCSETDQCCTPMGGIGKDAECTYRRQEGKKCSPVKDPCCTEKCLVVVAEVKKICSDIDMCTEEAYCDGKNAQCPASPHKQDWEPCQERTGVCQQGQCITNVCSVKVTMEECRCTEPEFKCLKCCQATRTSCRPAHELGILSISGLSILHPKGTLCQKGTNKVCTTLGDCVDPFIGLRNSLVAKKKHEAEPEPSRQWSVTSIVLVFLVVALVLTICICLICWIIPFRNTTRNKTQCDDDEVCEIKF